MEWMSWLAMLLSILVGLNLNSSVRKFQENPDFEDIKEQIGAEFSLRTLVHPLTDSIENSRNIVWTVAAILALRNVLVLVVL